MKRKFDPSKERMPSQVDEAEDEGAPIAEEALATSPEAAAQAKDEQVAKKEAQTIKASDLEVPALKNLQPGDSMDLNVSVKVMRKDPITGDYDLEVTDIYSTEEQAQEQPQAAGPAGGLEAMLAGAQKA